ncbi:MAG: hypothetical protein AAF791_10015, partial [Bacteroidota bacterium]
ATPVDACRQTAERIARVTPTDPATIQAGLLAMTPRGEVGGFALQPGFVYVVALPKDAPEPAGTITNRQPVTGATIYTVDAEAVFG